MIKQLTILITLFLTSFTLFCQKTEFVKHDSIVFPIHKSNIGKIAFMNKTVSIENFKQTDFLTNFEVNDNTDLNIRVFLGNSLTNYLHLLSPQLSVDELTKNGNYQFTFLVDGKIIYVENLNSGAGSTESKNQRTVFRVPLISSINEDSWGKFLWNRFFSNGGQDAFTNGEHLIKIEIRPYLKLNEILVGNIIAEGQLKILIPEIVINEKLVKVQVIKPLKDWKISSEKVDISKIEELNRKIETKVFKNITSVVVIKNNKLLLEEYFNGANRNTLHDTRSVGKSFVSTLLGIAIKEGFIKDESLTLKNFYNLEKFQNYNKSKDSITLKSLLTMSSTFEGSDINSDSPGHEDKMDASNNWVDFTLNLPIDKTKKIGNQWDYMSASCIVLGDIIHKSVPNGLEKYSNEKLFKPLGITKFKWQLTPQKVANTAGSLQLRSLDFAKYGQLYKNEGIWNGKQILSKDWIEKSFSHQMTISENEYYGYLFWSKTYKVNGLNYEVNYASGNGGNRIYIFKDYPIVIVITSTAYNTPYGERQAEKIMQNYLIEAIVK